MKLRIEGLNSNFSFSLFKKNEKNISNWWK